MNTHSLDMRPARGEYSWGMGTHPQACDPPLLTPNGYHQNKYGWQAGGMHPTRLLSCDFCIWERLKIICVVFFYFQNLFCKDGTCHRLED